MSYDIKLEQLEGPLVVLLFFIHRDEINIYDIPISQITQDFLALFGLNYLSDLPKLKAIR